MHFFSVCTFKKARYIPINCRELNKLYGSHNYSVIVPTNEVEQFNLLYNQLNLEYINVIDESDYISLKEFKSIYQSLIDSMNIIDTNQRLIGWYYQQVLKLSHVFYTSQSEGVIMIDADTILLRKISFFEKSNSIVFKALYENNLFYKLSCIEILGSVVEPWFSSTVQIFSITPDESFFLQDSLNNFLNKKNESIGSWLSKIILTNTINKNQSINRPYISEQDLIGTSKLQQGAKKIKSLPFLRSGVIGEMNDWQMKFASLIGYSYVTYEEWILKKAKMNNIDFVIAIIINIPFIHKLLKKTRKLLFNKNL